MTATVSEPVPEGGQASNASSCPEMAEPEADLSRTGAVLESVLTRNILSTEEVIQRAATLAQARAYNARAGYAYAMARWLGMLKPANKEKQEQRWQLHGRQ